MNRHGVTIVALEINDIRVINSPGGVGGCLGVNWRRVPVVGHTQGACSSNNS